MPFLLRDRDFTADVAGVHSVLLVPCRFCPAASLAVRERQPYMKLLSRFMRTPAYESYVAALQARLEGQGIRTDVFDSRWPPQFVVCMWTAARRRALARRSAGYDAVMVLGCDGAVEVMRSTLQATGCRIIAAMEVEGIMNVIPTVRLPLTVSLELGGVTRVLQRGGPLAPPP